MAVKYLELKPSSVMDAIQEGNGVFCFDRDTRESFLLNSCTVSDALRRIRNAEETANKGFAYDIRGDFVNRISFWMEVPEKEQSDD